MATGCVVARTREYIQLDGQPDIDAVQPANHNGNTGVLQGWSGLWRWTRPCDGRPSLLVPFLENDARPVSRKGSS
jgi:hypothetical protein